VKNEEGEIFGAVEVSSDITIQKQSEERYREAYNQANLYKDLIAHDMNNILQNIRSSIELSTFYLKDSKNIDGIKELHRIIEEQVTRGANLVTNVHKLSEIGKYKIRLNKINPIKILEERIEYILNSYPNEEINIRKDYLEEPIMVQGNDLLMDVFENIIINAIKHNQHPVKVIQIKISREEIRDLNWIRFEFIDNGIGISDSDKENIFRGLYKSKVGGGMGVGLSLVRKIIENHDGKIWVENRFEEDHSKGSNFIILLKEV
jgi:signal transduction histidine kinase